MFRVSCPNWSAALCWHPVLASNRNIDFAISLERFIYLYNLNKFRNDLLQYHDHRFEHRSKFNKLSSAGERANAKHARARVGRRARKLNEEKSPVLR